MLTYADRDGRAYDNSAPWCYASQARLSVVSDVRRGMSASSKACQHEVKHEGRSVVCECFGVVLRLLALLVVGAAAVAGVQQYKY